MFADIHPPWLCYLLSGAPDPEAEGLEARAEERAYLLFPGNTPKLGENHHRQNLDSKCDRKESSCKTG